MPATQTLTIEVIAQTAHCYHGAAKGQYWQQLPEPIEGRTHRCYYGAVGCEFQTAIPGQVFYACTAGERLVQLEPKAK